MLVVFAVFVEFNACMVVCKLRKESTYITMMAKVNLQLLATLLLHAVIISVSSVESSDFHGIQKGRKRLRQRRAASLKEKPFRSDAALCARQCRRKAKTSRKLRQRCINQCKARRCNRRIAESRSRQIEGQTVEMARFYVQVSPDDDMSNTDEFEHFTVVLRDEWSPKGYARFKELVDRCFFDDSPFFRVVSMMIFA